MVGGSVSVVFGCESTLEFKPLTTLCSSHVSCKQKCKVVGLMELPLLFSLSSLIHIVMDMCRVFSHKLF